MPCKDHKRRPNVRVLLLLRPFESELSQGPSKKQDKTEQLRAHVPPLSAVGCDAGRVLISPAPCFVCVCVCVCVCVSLLLLPAAADLLFRKAHAVVLGRRSVQFGSSNAVGHFRSCCTAAACFQSLGFLRAAAVCFSHHVACGRAGQGESGVKGTGTVCRRSGMKH